MLETLFAAYVGYKTVDALLTGGKKKKKKRRKSSDYRDAPSWFHDHGKDL